MTRESETCNTLILSSPLSAFWVSYLGTSSLSTKSNDPPLLNLPFMSVGVNTDSNCQSSELPARRRGELPCCIVQLQKKNYWSGSAVWFVCIRGTCEMKGAVVFVIVVSPCGSTAAHTKHHCVDFDAYLSRSSCLCM